MSVSLTSHLTSFSTVRPYSAATEHPFLTAAGNGTLSHELLALYLSQDRLYAAHGYPRFIGLLLASIPFSSQHGVESQQEQLNERVVRLATYSLTNVIREVAFFVETAKRYGLDLEAWRERKQTRDYTAEMIRIAAAGRLEDAVVFLWAMERVYLDAWKYAASVRSSTASIEATPTNAALTGFIDNWTNSEFERFVDDLADLVNALDIKPGSESWARAGEIWSRVVELEEAFWPVGGDELIALSVVRRAI